jgi:hypothetical protein
MDGKMRLITLEGKTGENKYQEQRNVIRFTTVQTGYVVKTKAIRCRDTPYFGKQKPDFDRQFGTYVYHS